MNHVKELFPSDLSRVSQSVFYYEDQAQAWFPNAQMPESTVPTSLLRNDELSYGLVTSENPSPGVSYKTWTYSLSCP